MLDRDELAARIYCASIRAYREEVIGIPYELAVKHADGLLAALKTTTYDVNWLPPLKDERPMGIYRTEIPAKDMGDGYAPVSRGTTRSELDRAREAWTQRNQIQRDVCINRGWEGAWEEGWLAAVRAGRAGTSL